MSSHHATETKYTQKKKKIPGIRIRQKTYYALLVIHPACNPPASRGQAVCQLSRLSFEKRLARHKTGLCKRYVSPVALGLACTADKLQDYRFTSWAADEVAVESCEWFFSRQTVGLWLSRWL
jgi:hypothetical protein